MKLLYTMRPAQNQGSSKCYAIIKEHSADNYTPLEHIFHNGKTNP